MDIRVWADFHCPYCYIGKARMKKALREAGVSGARLFLRTYLLNPEASEREGESLNEYSINQYGAKPEKVYANNARLEAEARELGLGMDLKSARYANMTDAHRLFHHAKTRGLGEAFFDLAQQALFTRGALLSDRETLLTLAQQAGVPRDEAWDALTGDRYKAEVVADYKEGLDRAIDYIPYYVFGDGSHFSGDRSDAEYLSAVEKHLGGGKA